MMSHTGVFKILPFCCHFFKVDNMVTEDRTMFIAHKVILATDRILIWQTIPLGTEVNIHDFK